MELCARSQTILSRSRSRAGNEFDTGSGLHGCSQNVLRIFCDYLLTLLVFILTLPLCGPSTPRLVLAGAMLSFPVLRLGDEFPNRCVGVA